MAQAPITEQALLHYWRMLGPEQQRTALDFVEFLQRKSGDKPHRRSLLGLLANVDVDVTADDIAEVREEAWGDFPREM